MKVIFLSLCLALTVFAQEEYKNFSSAERFQTFGVNYFIPGLGSIVVMDDWVGAGVQWALIGTGTVLMADILINGRYYDYDGYDDEWYDPNHNLIKAVAIFYLFGINVLFNVTRSITYDNPKYVQQTLERNGSENFTAEQRFNTFGLSIIPGFGSIAIMNDWGGAITQWVLVGLGIMPLIDSYGSIDPSGIIFISFDILFNIYRSATYNNLKNVTFDNCDGFHLSVLQNRHGKMMPHFLFSKAF